MTRAGDTDGRFSFPGEPKNAGDSLPANIFYVRGIRTSTLTLCRLLPLALQLRSPQALQREVEARTVELATANANLQRTAAELERQREAAETADRQKNESSALLATTLRSVGDAVISTNAAGAVQFMNTVAETLTGWTEREAKRRTLDEVFHIVHEESRAMVESPVVKVLRERTIVGLANHTVLIGRDGTEPPIEDSGAPIMEGAVLVGVVPIKDQLGNVTR